MHAFACTHSHANAGLILNRFNTPASRAFTFSQTSSSSSRRRRRRRHRLVIPPPKARIGFAGECAPNLRASCSLSGLGAGERNILQYSALIKCTAEVHLRGLNRHSQPSTTIATTTMPYHLNGFSDSFAMQRAQVVQVVYRSTFRCRFNFEQTVWELLFRISRQLQLYGGATLVGKRTHIHTHAQQSWTISRFVKLDCVDCVYLVQRHTIVMKCIWTGGFVA